MQITIAYDKDHPELIGQTVDEPDEELAKMKIREGRARVPDGDNAEAEASDVPATSGTPDPDPDPDRDGVRAQRAASSQTRTDVVTTVPPDNTPGNNFVPQ